MDTREVAALINEQGRLLKSRFGSIDGRLDDLEKRVLRPGGGSTQVSYTDADRRKLGEALRKAVSGDDSELKAMSVSPDNAGGYLAVSLLDREIRSIRDSVSPLSRMCREIIVDNGTAIEQPVIRGALPGAWVSEHDTRPETESLAVSQARVELHEVYCMPVVTQRLLDDSSYNLGDLLLEQIGHGLASLEDTAIHSGTGVGQPRGFLTHTTAATGDATRDWGTLEHVATGASGAFKAASASPADCLFDVVAALNPRYRASAVWVMNRSTHSTVRKLKTATEGQYLLQPGLASAAPDTILGIPVVISESMPAIGANSLSIALGDFRQAMTVIRRSGYKVLRDPYSTKGRTAFYAYMRVGAGTVDFNAIKLLKFSAS